MSFRRVVVCDLEAVDGKLAKALECIKPLITYLEQTARTAAETQQLQNARDARELILKAQRKLVEHHPERRE
jgi:hypothetical protein